MGTARDAAWLRRPRLCLRPSSTRRRAPSAGFHPPTAAEQAATTPDASLLYVCAPDASLPCADRGASLPPATQRGRLGRERRVITSHLANIGLSHSIAQLTKHEYTSPVYLYLPYQTRVICIDLVMLRPAWLQILAKLELAKLPNTPMCLGS
jgi:hypothetical protein